MRKQCPKCPWKVGVDPRTIPRGYSEEKHRALTNTIAEPGAINIGAKLHIMACHDSPTGAELPCVGWLDNQLGDGNNIALRIAVSNGRINAQYELDGPQHACFADTLPGKSS